MRSDRPSRSLGPADVAASQRSSAAIAEPGRRRGADRGGGGRRQSSRRPAAAGRLPAAAGASDMPGLEVAGRVVALGPPVDGVPVALARGRRGLRAGRRRRLRRILRRRRRCSACRCRRAARWSRRRPSPRPSSRSGPTSSSAAGCRRASRSWSTADRAASAPPRFSWRSAFGARVFATAGSAAKCARLRAARRRARGQLPRAGLGARCCGEATAGRGVDVILDMVGGDYVARNLTLLAVEGRLVQIAFLKSSKAELDLMQVMRRRLTHHRLDAAAAIAGREGRHRRRARGAGLAAARRRHGEAGHPRRVPAGPGRRGAPDDGGQRAHRQDRAAGRPGSVTPLHFRLPDAALRPPVHPPLRRDVRVQLRGLPVGLPAAADGAVPHPRAGRQRHGRRPVPRLPHLLVGDERADHRRHRRPGRQAARAGDLERRAGGVLRRSTRCCRTIRRCWRWSWCTASSGRGCWSPPAPT